MLLSDMLYQDPTLLAADKALEAKALSEPRRASRLGMGAIGESCARKTWYRFRLASREAFGAKTLKLFADGHAAEAVQAERLRLVDGIHLDTADPKTGNQFEYTDWNGHFVGKCDGKITGLLQAPIKLHVWEHKSVGEKKIAEFRKIRAEVGEKKTLRKWNYQYWIQAILYMYYEGTDRHYLTVSTPGVRETESCRTEADTAEAIRQTVKAKRIIDANEPPERISKDASWYECRWCTFSGICHQKEIPDRTCRTCLHSTVMPEGAWHCARWGKTLTSAEQIDGCPAHKFLPKMVAGEVINADDKGVTYKLEDGSAWYDGE